MSSGAQAGGQIGATVGQTGDPEIVPTNLFHASPSAVANVQDAEAPNAWQRLMHALGRDLQGGMHRAEQARRRMEMMRSTSRRR
jgi:hypothetical protein